MQYACLLGWTLLALCKWTGVRVRVRFENFDENVQFQNHLFGIADNLICNFIDYEMPYVSPSMRRFIHSLLTNMKKKKRFRISLHNSHTALKLRIQFTVPICMAFFLLLFLCFVSDTHMFVQMALFTVLGVTCLLKWKKNRFQLLLLGLICLPKQMCIVKVLFRLVYFECSLSAVHCRVQSIQSFQTSINLFYFNKVIFHLSF